MAEAAEEVVVEQVAAMEEDAAPEPETAAEEERPAPVLKPGERVKRPVRPDDTEVKAQIDALQQQSEGGVAGRAGVGGRRRRTHHPPVGLR